MGDTPFQDRAQAPGQSPVHPAVQAPIQGYNPAKLAAMGDHVRAHLTANPAAEKIDTELADMFVIERFLTRRDCRDIAATINRNAQPSTLFAGTGDEKTRTSWTHHFAAEDPLTRSIEQYISDLVGLDDLHSELMQGQRYSAGQEYRHHHDYFPVGASYWAGEAARGGQRCWTAMIFLSEPKKGGETDFPKLGQRFTPKAGRMLVWNNMDRNGMPNAKTLHAAMPVQQGVKHVITKWYRQDPWRLLNLNA